MVISDILFNMHVKFKIIHSIPGRLRIHVPSAKKIPEIWYFENKHFELFRCIPGILNIDFNYLTSNALIKYDPKRTNENDIILNIKQLTQLAHKYKNKLSSFDIDNKDDIHKFFSEIINSEFNSI